MNNEYVYRTAPSTQGLKITLGYMLLHSFVFKTSAMHKEIFKANS